MAFQIIQLKGMLRDYLLSSPTPSSSDVKTNTQGGGWLTYHTASDISSGVGLP